MNGIQMNGDRILVEPIEVNKEPGRVILPNMAAVVEKASPYFGIVRAVGPGRFVTVENGEVRRTPVTLKVGDKVMFRDGLFNNPVRINKKRYIRMGHDDVEAVVSDDLDLNQAFMEEKDKVNIR